MIFHVELDWTADASCRGFPPDTFFPVRQGLHHPEVQEAVEVCGRCPVRQTCLDLALAHENSDPSSYRFGIYGGLTARQRNALVKERGGIPVRPPRRPSVDLTDEVEQIAQKYRDGDTIRAIADDYGCSSRTIHRMLHGRSDITMRGRGGNQRPQREAS